MFYEKADLKNLAKFLAPARESFFNQVLDPELLLA